MRDRPLTIATYAAGASLAAITLVYVFGPTFFLDDEAANSSRASRKKGVVGLVNPANDCFINSVLQALAGLPELRAFLIQEVHRRELVGWDVYNDLGPSTESEQHVQRKSKKIPDWQLLGQQHGIVTEGLKDVLNALNERPIYKKTVSAAPFIRVLEMAFKTRISRSQQDAQEFLQIVVERLADEYYAGQRVRSRIERNREPVVVQEGTGREEADLSSQKLTASDADSVTHDSLDSELKSFEAAATTQQKPMPAKSNGQENTLPIQGHLESQVECTFCHFKPKPSVSRFLTLTLNVPHDETTTSLDACFDGLFKVEQIDDFLCDKCRLVHAVQLYTQQLSKISLSASERAELESKKSKVEAAVHSDPENPPKDVELPDKYTVPKRRITKHGRISTFPQILAIHLSRSVWDPHSISTKNMAKVSFPETLRLGSLLDRKTYRLLGVVTHKGGHNSGHYESFRRQVLNPPFSTPNSMGTQGIYSPRSTPLGSVANSPHLGSTTVKDLPMTTPIDSGDVTSSSASSCVVPNSVDRWNPTNVPLEAIPTPGLPDLPANTERSAFTAAQNPAVKEDSVSLLSKNHSVKRSGKSGGDRWWRISDDKIKESKTAEVLSMQREVYLLFYDMISPEVA